MKTRTERQTKSRRPWCGSWRRSCAARLPSPRVVIFVLVPACLAVLVLLGVLLTWSSVNLYAGWVVAPVLGAVLVGVVAWVLLELNAFTTREVSYLASS